MKNRKLLPFALLAMAAAQPTFAATITWAGGDTSGNWSNTASWDTLAVPGSADTAVLTDVASGSRTILYDTNAPATAQQITFNQETAGAVNLLQFDRSATVTNPIVLGATAGTERITFNAASTSPVLTITNAGGITLNPGGELGLAAFRAAAGTGTTGTVRFGNVTGNVSITGGSLTVQATENNVASNTATSAANTLTGNLSMSSGSMSIDNAVGVGDRRLVVLGNVNISGGDLSSTSTSANPQFSCDGELATLNPATFGSRMILSFGRSGAQTVNLNFTSNAITVRNTGIKTITSSALGNQIGQVTLIDTNTTPGSRVTLRLGSNLASKITGNGIGQPMAATFSQSAENGRIDLGIDTNGFSLDLSPAGGWTPNHGAANSGSAVVNSTVWDLSGSGSIRATNFNFSNSGVTVNVGAGTTLISSSTAATTNNLGSVGTIDPTSTFHYSGTLSSTLTSGRTLGNVLISNNGTLTLLATSAASAYSNGMTVRAGSLTVGANSLLGGPTATPIKLSDGLSIFNSRITLQFGNGIDIDRPIDVSAAVGPGPLGTGADTNSQRARIQVTGSNSSATVSGPITYGRIGGIPTILEVSAPATSTLSLSGQISPVANATASRTLLINGGNSGTGTVVLSNAANTYTGGTVVTNGTLVITDNVPSTATASPIGTSYLGFADGATPEDATVSALVNGPFNIGRNVTLATNASQNGTKYTAVIGMTGEAAGTSIWSGNFTSNNDARTKTLRVTAPAAATVQLSGAIAANPGTGTVGIDKVSGGKLELSGTNTYDGNTVVSEGTLHLQSTGQIRFILGSTSGTTTSISGAGTAIIDGKFLIDDTAAAALSEGSWTIENVSSLTGAYGSTFSVVGYTDAGNDKWTKDAGNGKIWTFDETTGVLTLGNAVTATPFETWITTNYPQIPLADRAPGADPDGDGSSNILEFALKGDPTNPSANGLMASLIQNSSAPATDELTLVVAVRDGAQFNAGSAKVDGITYTVEGSVDLTFPGSSVSSTGPSDTAPAATGLPSLADTAWEYHTFKLNASEGLGGKGFLRVKVSQPD